MPRTPISPELQHEPGTVTEDGRKIEYMCDLAIQIAYPYARDVLWKETAAGAAQIVADDAASLLSGLLDDPQLPKAEVEEMQKELSGKLAIGMARPEEEEVFRHAQALSSTVVSAWLQVLLNKRTEGRDLTSSEILPQSADGSDRDWADVWRSALPYGLEGDKAFEMLRELISSFVDDPQLTKDEFVELPGNLRLERQAVIDAVEREFA